MIQFKSHTLVSVITMMAEQKDILFYATGSRYFGNNAEGADFDFFTEYSEETEIYLIELGFTKIHHNPYYKVPHLVSLYRWIDSRHTSEVIEVQLVRDAKVKARVQMHMKEHLGYQFPKDKDMARKLWNMAYSFYQDRVEL